MTERITFTAEPSPATRAFGDIVVAVLPPGVTATITHSTPRGLHEVVLAGPRGRTRVAISDALAADSPAAVAGEIKQAAQYLGGAS